MNAVTDTLHLSTPQVQKLTGISFRMLDYWARLGVVRPSVAATSGSGVYRRWSHDDLARLLVISEAWRDLRSIGNQHVSAELIGDMWGALSNGRASVTHGRISISLAPPISSPETVEGCAGGGPNARPRH